MNKKLLIVFSLLLTLISVGYVVFNQQKSNNVVDNTTVLETTTTTIQPTINKADRIPLCSNQYYKTEYYNRQPNDEEWDVDGRIVIKDFPYRKIKKGEYCKESEVMATLPIHLQGVIMSEKDFEDFKNNHHICYPKNLSLAKINNLLCVQKIELSGMYSVGDFSDSIENCFFKNDDLQNLSNMINLEHITFHSCDIININSDWWKNLTKLKSIKIRFPVFGGGDNFNRIDSNKWVEEILSILPLIKTVDTLDIRADYMSSFPLLPNYHKAICSWAKLSNKDLFIFVNNYKIFVKDNRFRLESYQESFPRSLFNKWMTCEEWIEFDRDWTSAESWDL